MHVQCRRRQHLLLLPSSPPAIRSSRAVPLALGPVPPVRHHTGPTHHILQQGYYIDHIPLHRRLTHPGLCIQGWEPAWDLLLLHLLPSPFLLILPVPSFIVYSTGLIPPGMRAKRPTLSPCHMRERPQEQQKVEFWIFHLHPVFQIHPFLARATPAFTGRSIPGRSENRPPGMHPRLGTFTGCILHDFPGRQGHGCVEGGGGDNQQAQGDRSSEPLGAGSGGSAWHFFYAIGMFSPLLIGRKRDQIVG
ncbi:hypothetical protein NGA_0076500 [Nannochloropsis gaditana CCMP526]|uniref:uncharacterized protein n=1 Tax=Nannochloropsis gaditana (strain CCMP526) TaxID=1093141 RepID=UPI00029F550D|nr:hypothetical protein NGA_0076500 [Nannochloropsis gaditana CCMP526]EKU21061.1 hypothetical protein NGA_0076500 [Nannochloropsis gaditana CCMP526]|eukprot:XP_005855305.1 hypothetical protein NGA_0076500 [Nannochloropsis gaditana CCMP526]